jgi:methylmalonyl-CoA mutase
VLAALKTGSRRQLAQIITALENGAYPEALRKKLLHAAAGLKVPTLGITGTGGAGKSSLTDELVRRFRLDQGDTDQAGDHLDRSVAQAHRRCTAR